MYIYHIALASNHCLPYFTVIFCIGKEFWSWRRWWCCKRRYFFHDVYSFIHCSGQ